jgi:CheY-like chemotaxis protein
MDNNLVQNNLAQRLFNYLMGSDVKKNELKNLDVLIVDDERSLTELIAEAFCIFFQGGISCDFAYDGADALNKVKNHLFDVILLDIEMPVMDGYEAALKIAEIRPEIPIIIYTGNPGDFRSRRTIEEGLAITLIQKPVRIRDLTIIVLDVVQMCKWVENNFPRSFAISPDLYCCKNIIQEFFQHNQNENIFGAVIRHKVKDIVRGFCNEIEKNIVNCKDLTSQMAKKVLRLKEMMNQIQHGSSIGLVDFLKGLKEDRESTQGKIKIVLSQLPKLQSIDISKNLETLLAFCTLELTDNAFHAISGKGNIKIKLRKVITSNAIQLIIHNNGPKIQNDLVEHVFEEGVTTKGSGRGMGLYILKNLCNRFNGDITLNQDDGVQFSVILPINPQ